MKIYQKNGNKVHLLLSRNMINSLIGHLKQGDIIAECSLEEVSHKYNGKIFRLNYTESLKNWKGFDCSGKIKNKVFNAYINEKGLSNLMRNRNIGGNFLDYTLFFETPVGSNI